MTSVVFDARIREDHLIGFFVPVSITPGSNCSFSITVTHLDPNGGPSILLGIITFNKVIPADRHVVFTCPASYPLGMAHFVALITVLTAATITTTVSASVTQSASTKCDEPEEQVTSQSE